MDLGVRVLEIDKEIQELAALQYKLDSVIYERFPGLVGKDNIIWKVNALTVEMGECLQEWRGFKKWKKDRTPVTEKKEVCPECKGSNYLYTVDSKQGKVKCKNCKSGEVISNPLLEEYIDWLHFILSLGLEAKFNFSKGEYEPQYYMDVVGKKVGQGVELEDALNEFILNWNKSLYDAIYIDINNGGKYNIKLESYERLVSTFIAIGGLFGFTWEDMYNEYLNKNNVNHQRQDTGY